MTRDRILDAALRCIEEQSLVHASSAQIARQAGMTWGATPTRSLPTNVASHA